MTDSGNTRTHKQAALQFLQLVVAGRIEDAYKQFVDMRGKHHNPFFAAGFPTLQRAMIADHQRSPHKLITAVHVLEDGDLVAVHSHLVRSPGENGMTTVHVFRFQDDKIVELWDCGQSLPEDSPNTDGAF